MLNIELKHSWHFIKPRTITVQSCPHTPTIQFILLMTKRLNSSDWSLPSSLPLKLARQDCHSQLDLSELEKSSSLPPTTSDDLANVIAEIIEEKDHSVESVFWVIRRAFCKKHVAAPNGATEVVHIDIFCKNLQKHEGFSVVVDKACSEEATPEDWQALFAHGVCFSIPQIQIMSY